MVAMDRNATGQSHEAAGLLTPKEAANLLRVSVSTVYRLMERCELPWTKIGSSRRIPRAAVQAMMNDHLVGEGTVSKALPPEPIVRNRVSMDSSIAYPPVEQTRLVLAEQFQRVKDTDFELAYSLRRVMDYLEGQGQGGVR